MTVEMDVKGENGDDGKIVSPLDQVRLEWLFYEVPELCCGLLNFL